MEDARVTHAPASLTIYLILKPWLVCYCVRLSREHRGEEIQFLARLGSLSLTPLGGQLSQL